VAVPIDDKRFALINLDFLERIMSIATLESRAIRSICVWWIGLSEGDGRLIAEGARYCHRERFAHSLQR